MHLALLPPASRAAIDTAIDGAITRIADRAEHHGQTATRLASAIGRAATGGKRFRPALVAAAHRACGGADDTGVAEVAAAFELLHTAFVVHDDVIDRDTMRRGTPNVSGAFAEDARRAGAPESDARLLGDAAGILGGDLLLHEAIRMVALADLDGTLRTRLLDILDDAIQLSAAGELADVENALLPGNVDPARILAATRDKTAAYSFSGPLKAGGVLARTTATAVEALGRCGQELGLAFQLVDDLIGAFASADLAGRESGADLRERKETALIALARESDLWSPATAKALALAPTGPVAVLGAQRALEDTGARARVVAMVESSIDSAIAIARDAELSRAVVELVEEIGDAVRTRMPS